MAALPAMQDVRGTGAPIRAQQELLAQSAREAEKKAKDELKKKKKLSKINAKSDMMRSQDGEYDGGPRRWKLGDQSGGGNRKLTGMEHRLSDDGSGDHASYPPRPGSTEAHLQGAPLLLPTPPETGSVPPPAAAVIGAFQLEVGSKWKQVQLSEQVRALKNAGDMDQKWGALVKPWMAKYDMAARVWPGSLEERLKAAKKEGSEMRQKEKLRLAALDKRAHHLLDEIQFLVTRKVEMTHTSSRFQQDYAKMNAFLGESQRKRSNVTSNPP